MVGKPTMLNMLLVGGPMPASTCSPHTGEERCFLSCSCYKTGSLLLSWPRRVEQASAGAANSVPTLCLRLVQWHLAQSTRL